MNLFGKKKAPAPSVQQSIFDLQAQIDRLEKREVHLQGFIEELNAEAKQRLQKNDRKGAVSTLRRRKLKERDLDKIEGMKYNLYVQISAMEEAAQNKQHIKVMMKAREALRQQLSDRDVDNAAEVMDDLEEQRSLIEEFGRALAQPIGGEMADEEELDAELAELQAELDSEAQQPVLQEPARQQPVVVGGAPQQEAPLADLGKLPQLPAMAQPQPVAQDEDDELAALMD